MFRIALVNLPFAAYHYPSVGLTQLRSVLHAELGDRVQAEIVYANHDFANFLGLDLYDRISGSGKYLHSGFAEWFFRQAAFPHLADNSEEFFARYYPGRDPESLEFRRRIDELRGRLDDFLDEVIDKYRLDETDATGFTSMFFENNVSFALARKIKARRPEVLTLMGGANCESPAGEELARHVEALDFVFSGSALTSLPAFVRNCLDGDVERNHRLDGVFSKVNRVGGGGVVSLGGGPTVGHMGRELDINTPIELDYDSFFEDLDANFPDQEILAVIPFETSRGCWWGEHAHCTFCGLNKSTMEYRAMRPDLALELIRSLFKYRERASVLMCVDNILDRSYTKELFPYLDTPEDLAIFYQLKANLKEAEVEAMARARVKTITPGFESLNSDTLKLMSKGVTAFQNLRVMKYCLLHDVFPGWNLLVASPGEGEDVYAKYDRELPDLVHLPPPQAVFSIHFNRYSPYFLEPEKYGLDLQPLDYYEMVYPFDQDVLANIAYDFADQNVDADYVLALSKWIDRLQERVRQWRARWNDESVSPKLFVERREGESWIHDSRSGEVVRHPLGPEMASLLDHLETPRKLEQLTADTTGIQGLDVPREVAWLEEHGMLFREDDRVMNLVLPRDYPPMSFRSSGISVQRRPRRTLQATGPVPELVPVARRPRRLVKRPT